MRIKVIKDFVTKKGRYHQSGSVFDVETSEDDKFYKSLLEYKFIKEMATGNVEDMEKNTIRSKLANVIIAGCDYAEGNKKYFTWDEAMALKDKLPDGWRLPTRSEWVLICEEFGQKDGGPDVDTLIKNIGVGRHGLVITDGLRNAGSYGYYWSSSPYSNGTSAYLLYFGSGNLYPFNYYNRYGGFSVRLVKDLETQPLDTSKRGE